MLHLWAHPARWEHKVLLCSGVCLGCDWSQQVWKRQKVTFSDQGAVCVSITRGGESCALQEHPVCSWGGDQWVAGDKSYTYNLLCQRDTAPANITCQRNSSFSTFLGCVINSSLNDLKCEIYQPSVIFSVIYSIWCDPPNFGVEIKLVEFTFHSFFLLYSPGTCLVFVFWMCI